MLRLEKVGSGFSGLAGFFRSSNQPHKRDRPDRRNEVWFGGGVPGCSSPQQPVFLRTAIRLGWGTAQLIESDHAGNARDADVGVDGNGNAAAVLFRHDGTRNDIASNVFR